MRLFTYLRSLFEWADMPSHITSNPVPPPAPPTSKQPPEPSCLAKGVARAWIHEKGWKVTRSLQRDVRGMASHWAVTLRHERLDITITFWEAGLFPAVEDIRMVVLGKSDISPYSLLFSQTQGCADYHHIHQTILSHPYPALKRRQVKQARQEATRADKLKAIEALGCPPEPPVPPSREPVYHTEGGLT